MRKILAVLVAVGVTFAGGMAVPALVTADATSGQTITKCTTISEAGHYTLGQNLTSTAGESCLQIESSDVVLDGAGYSLSGGGNGVAIDVSANEVRAQDTYQNVTVRDVRLESWETGVSLVNTRNATISGIEVTNTTTGVEVGNTSVLRPGYPASADGTTIRESTFVGNEDGVIIKISEGIDVAENQFVDSQLGVNLDESGTEDIDITQNAVENSTIKVSDGSGYEPDISVKSNEIQDGTIVIRQADNTSIANNFVRTTGTTTAGNPGIVVGMTDGATVANNTVTGSGTGILLDTGTREASVKNNTVHDVGTGIEIYDSVDATVQNNTITDTETGVELSFLATGHTISGNEIRDNDAGISLGRYAENNVIEENRIIDNVDGVKISVLESVNGDANIVRGNDILDNTDGVDVFATVTPVVVESNNVSDNKNGVHVHSPAACYADSAEGAELVSVHGNDLRDNNAYGVINEDPDTLNATGNYWGASDGPSSANDSDAPFSDPVTGTLANGTGSAVSENPDDAGVTNVHFDSYRESPIDDVGVHEETAT
ncbi:right-handed parallel beta-helix repeat-containing protein [Haloferax sp. DFSO52]|uniref:right-handed parallel beta-helix repeat-containing protein n=1 Tax=Haloferax sp. DFSO52 TaxID=3388505 RepID=UPI003A847DA4